MEVPSTPENMLNLSSMSPQITNAHSLISRLQDNNILFISQGHNDQGQDALYVSAWPEQSTPQEIVLGEISFGASGVSILAKSYSAHMPGLFLQAAKFLLQAP